MLRPPLSKSEIVVLTSGLISLLIVILIFRRSPFGDEAYYLTNVSLLQQHGFSNKFITSLNGSAGPLFAFFHYNFKPFTHLQSPNVRLVSLGFLLSTLYFTFVILRLLKATNWTYALYTMAVPMVYLVGGLALTEMPAMFFFSMGLFFIVKSTQQKITSTYANTLIYTIIGSFFVSISILGRQPYFIVVLALPILYLSKNFSFKDCFVLLSAILFVTTIPFFLFYTWKGLVPPSDAAFYSDITGLGTKYRIDYFILCLFYFAVSMFLIAPNFYCYPKKNKVLIFTGTCLLIITINQISNFLSYIPFLSTTEKMIPSNFNKQLVANLSGSSIILFALYFLVNCFVHIARQKFSKEFSFFIIALLLMAFSCSKITWGFSSRYAAQAIPLLVITGSYFYTPSKLNVVRIIAGIVIGIVSLISYFIG